MGERKPQAGPFKEAVKRAGYPSENAVGGEWVHVGDDWASDCVGGKVHHGSILVHLPFMWYTFLTCSETGLVSLSTMRINRSPLFQTIRSNG